MIITSTENKVWQEGKTTEKKGIELSFGEKGQKIRGFGTCFSELSALALNELDTSEKEAILDELFGKDGCNFNYCRTPIGASDFATDFYSYNETPGDYEMKNFSIERDRKLLLPLILEGVKRQDEMQMFASPWCPPLWLKTHPVYSYGVFNKTEENYRAYALYFKKYVEEYLKNGVPLVHVHPQNEPCSNQVFPSCVWHGDELTEFIGGYLGPALDGTGVDVFYGTINGPEGGDRYAWTKYCHYLGQAMKDENARKYIKGVGYQWAGKFAVPQTRDDFPELEIIQTESECGDGANTWERMMEVFGLMRHYFRFGVSAYVYWNLALKKDQPSTWGWKQNSLVSVHNGKATYTPEYYLMKHFSHFIKRGAHYVKLNGEYASGCAAFENPDGTRVVVAYNPYENEQTITIEGKSYTLPVNSVNTIVID
ncbi:MAG: glycoside hydrolase family 30 protein [Clostridia bacterium]|nr:glycoside hydrolase family 30 protein [Clostridia bacterium]